MNGGRQFHHILALLGDDEQHMWSVVERAIELADAERARLALAKTTDPGWVVRWFGPVAVTSRTGTIVAIDTEHQRRMLDRASAHVPASIPLTRVLLAQDTARALHRLAEGVCFDLLVADEETACNRRLRREVRRLELCTLTVCCAPRAREPLPGVAPGRDLVGGRV